jgi:hypothetical protein
MRWLLAALWMSVIFATSCTVVFRPAFVGAVGRVLPGRTLQGLWTGFWYSCGLIVVKGYHAAEFALLFLLVRMALHRLGARRATIIAVVSCLCYAISDEWHQTFVPGRGGSWTDVVFDMGGVSLTVMLSSQAIRGRAYQGLLILSTLGLSWLGMQIVHEAGHVLLAWIGGETVHRVILHPLAISRTDSSHDHHPLLVAWGGPALGALLPLVALGAAKLVRAGDSYLFQFFAGFCLITNGSYLGIGSFEGVGDAGDLIRHGTPRGVLIAFGVVAVPLGLHLWNGLGPSFGLGNVEGRVSRRAALGTLVVLAVVVIVELLASGR